MSRSSERLADDGARRWWVVAGLCAAAVCIVGLSTGSSSPPLKRLAATGALVGAVDELPLPGTLAPDLAQASAPLLAKLGRTLEDTATEVPTEAAGPPTRRSTARPSRGLVDESAPDGPVEQPPPATVEVDQRVLVDEDGVAIGVL